MSGNWDEVESSVVDKGQLPLSLEDKPEYSMNDELSQDQSCLLAPDRKSSVSSSSTKNTEAVLIESEHTEASLDPTSVKNTTYIKNKDGHFLSNEREQSDVLLCLPSSDPRNPSEPILGLPISSPYNVSSTSITENTNERAAPNEHGHNERVLLCLPEPANKKSEYTSCTESTDGVRVLYERVPRPAYKANAQNTHVPGQKKELYSLPIDSNQSIILSNEREQSDVLLCLPSSDPRNPSEPILGLPISSPYNVSSTSITENTNERAAPNEHGHNERVLLCLPEPANKKSEYTSCTESTDGVRVLYERVPRPADKANAQSTHVPGQKKELYSLPLDSNQSEKTDEEEGNQEPIKDQIQTVGQNTLKTTEMLDAFSTFIQSKVTIIQANVLGERAKNIQKAVEQSIKYYLYEVEKLEPLFRVSELLQVGSYAEGTKLFKPDEFDFLAVIESLSREGTFDLEPNPTVSHSVRLSLAKEALNTSLCKLCGENGKLECFTEPPLEKAFGGPAKFGKVFVQAVRNSYFDKVFKRVPSYFIHRTPLGMDFLSGGLVMPPVDKITLVLKAVEFSTPNVFLRYKLNDLDITVDLSPAIRYHKMEDCIDSEKLTCPELLNAVWKHGSCLLVGNKRGGFRVTITECEVIYMQKILKTKHKLLYIFLKYMCSVFDSGIQPFSSYMLKNICIHHDYQCQSESKILKTCFENIIEDITTYCAVQKLPSILNKDVELFCGSVPDLDGKWHLRRHFLMVLQKFHDFSDKIISSELLETVLKDTITESLKTFHVRSLEPSCEVCEKNVTEKLQTAESIRKGSGYPDSDLLK